MAIRERKKLGDLLREAGLVTETQIIEALAKKKPNQKLGDLLVEQGYITETQLLQILEVQLNLKSVSLYTYPIDEALTKLVPKDFARSNLLIPIKEENNRLTVAMNDPLDFYSIEEIELSTGYNLSPVLASKDDILQTINRIYGAEEFDLKQLGREDSPAVRVLDQLLISGVTMHASDIHIDPYENDIVIRFRVDGILHTDRNLPKALMSSLAARVKIMAGLNIMETRLPQDGRIGTTISGDPVNLRVSTLPTVFGEKIVIRILEMSNIFNSVKNIGLQEDTLAQYEKLIRSPSGLILLTGPTGSGKSSTLYGSVNELNSAAVNIITVEDPVEYQLYGINQVQVNTDIGLTFAGGLRSILRQDPNIIMVGEIRDSETAQISIRAALTGHLVFSTLHTNSAIDAIPRLYDMGIEPYLVISSLRGVMAQRLVKKICKDCAETHPANHAERKVFQKRGMDIEQLTVGTGCNACRQTGYRGRMAIHELIVITEDIKHLLMENATMTQLEDHLKQTGVRFLLDDGLEKVKQGDTTIDEVLRVASLD